MARVAASVTWPPFKEDRFDASLEKLKIENLCRGGCGGGRCRGGSHRGEAADPFGNHLPLRVVPGFPKFTSRMERIATGLWCERVQQKPALGGIAGSY